MTGTGRNGRRWTRFRSALTLGSIRDVVDPSPPQLQMVIAMTDASPEARWLAERSEVAGYSVVIVSAFFGGQGEMHMISHAHRNLEGGVLCQWRWKRRKGKLM